MSLQFRTSLAVGGGVGGVGGKGPVKGGRSIKVEAAVACSNEVTVSTGGKEVRGITLSSLDKIVVGWLPGSPWPLCAPLNPDHGIVSCLQL
ncbi:hypothetical protein E2C01_092579 [Portunus trituberculatus]|uniref:Uncharacterized protein n=1 Tax=Portunus trituberculatus TaxID=210409 RepID=A0A5B7JY46_PORTR|nr:hypothetical protein [Portunus trituberculatus]